MIIFLFSPPVVISYILSFNCLADIDGNSFQKTINNFRRKIKLQWICNFFFILCTCIYSLSNNDVISCEQLDWQIGICGTATPQFQPSFLHYHSFANPPLSQIVCANEWEQGREGWNWGVAVPHRPIYSSCSHSCVTIIARDSTHACIGQQRGWGVKITSMQ